MTWVVLTRFFHLELACTHIARHPFCVSCAIRVPTGLGFPAISDIGYIYASVLLRGYSAQRVVKPQETRNTMPFFEHACLPACLPVCLLCAAIFTLLYMFCHTVLN